MNEGNSYSYLGANGQHASSSPWLEKQQSANRKSKLMVRPPTTTLWSGAGELSWPLAKAFVMLKTLVWEDG